MIDKSNLDVDTLFESYPLLKTTIVLLFINWINSLVRFLDTLIPGIHIIDSYILLLGHILLALTAIVSLILNYSKVKTIFKSKFKKK